MNGILINDHITSLMAYNLLIDRYPFSDLLQVNYANNNNIAYPFMSFD